MNLKLFIRRVDYIERHQAEIGVRRGRENFRLSQLPEDIRFQESMLLAIRPTAPAAILATGSARENVSWWNDPAAAELQAAEKQARR